MNVTQRNVDLGTACQMKPSSSKLALVQVGPGTPMGELRRRYRQPVRL